MINRTLVLASALWCGLLFAAGAAAETPTSAPSHDAGAPVIAKSDPLDEAKFIEPELLQAEHAERALIIIAPGFRDIEFFYAWYKFHDAGYRVTVIAPQKGLTYGLSGAPVDVHYSFDSIEANWFTFVFVPGGPSANTLRGDARVQKLLKAVADNQKYIASCSEGVRVLIDAGLIKPPEAKRAAGPPETAAEIRATGVAYHDGYVAIGPPRVVTGRQSGSMPRLMSQFLYLKKKFEDMRH